MTRTFQLAALVLLTSTGLSSVSRAAAAAELPEAPDATMQRVIRGFAQGDGGMLWQALPDSYQRDLNALARTSSLLKFDNCEESRIYGERLSRAPGL